MADLTYAQMAAAVGQRLGNRSDLDTVARSFIQDRINYYSKNFFYSAQFIDTDHVCTIGSPWVDLPAGWSDIANIRILQSASIYIPLVRVAYNVILYSDVLVPPFRNLPSQWCTFNDPSTGNRAIRLFPTPNLAYPLEFTMDKPPDPPSADTDINWWTQDAQTLIIEAACEDISALYLNDPVRQEKHKEARMREELSLNSKSIRIRGGIQVKSHI